MARGRAEEPWGRAVAATAIFRRLGVPSRVVTSLESSRWGSAADGRALARAVLAGLGQEAQHQLPRDVEDPDHRRRHGRGGAAARRA